jgi:hypothetical protein
MASLHELQNGFRMGVMFLAPQVAPEAFDNRKRLIEVSWLDADSQ